MFMKQIHEYENYLRMNSKMILLYCNRINQRAKEEFYLTNYYQFIQFNV